MEEIEEEDEESEEAEESNIEEREERLEDDTLLGGRGVGSSRLFQVRDVEDGTAPTLRVHSIEPSKLVHDENTPLLERSKSRSHSRRRRMSVGPHGDATVGQAILMACRTSLMLHDGSNVDCDTIVTQVFCWHRRAVPWQSVRFPL